MVNEDALKELEECNYPIRRNGPSGYNKSRDKIRFLGTPDNTDDIKSTIDIPSWKRMAVCILKTITSANIWALPKPKNRRSVSAN